MLRANPPGLPAKLAKLRRELIAPPGGGGGGPGIGFDVARTGIASVGFVGFPSVVSIADSVPIANPTLMDHAGEIHPHVEIEVRPCQSTSSSARSLMQ